MSTPFARGGGISIHSLQDLHPELFERFVSWSIRAAIVAYGIFTVVGMAIHPDRPASRIGEFVVLGLAVAAAILQRRGRARPAAIMLLAAVFLELHVSLVVDGISYAPGLIGTPVLILTAGFFLGLRWAWRMMWAVWIGVGGAWLAFRARQGHLESLADFTALLQTPEAGQDLGTLAFVVVIGLVTALLTSLSLQTLGGLVEQAEASRRRFAVLVERVPDALLGLDAQGRIETVNHAAESLFDRDQDALLGRTLEELTLPGGARFSAQVPVASLVAVERGEALLTLPFPGGMRELEVRVRTLPRDDGQPGRVVILRDVTEVREARERLAQLGRIVDDTLHEIHVFGRDDLQVFYLNHGARENLGYGGDDLPPTVTAINPTLTPQSVARLFRTPGEEARVLRGIQRRRDGSVYPVESIFQAGTFQGAPAVIAFVVDVTDRVRAEEEQHRLQRQLEHSQRLEAVGHLAGGVAHDFNNLLTVMGACAESLREEVPPDAQELVDELLQAQERGAHLTRQLLAFARKEVVQPEVLSVAEALTELDTLARRLLTERIRFQVEVEGEPHVVADRGQFEQVVVNLLANARDALPDGGGVRISARAEEGSPTEAVKGPHLRLEVADDGVGMDASVRERIFEPFFTTKPRGKGTGLGLATVHGIVAQNRGAVEVESAPGQGTRVRILWPLAEPEPVQLPTAGADAAPVTHSSLRILFAEDNDTARLLLTRLLERSGHRVSATASGEEALERYEAEGGGFDLLLSDVVMPGLSGIELADELALRGFQGPVLFVSGYLDGHLPREGGVGAGRDLLLKPFRKEDLLSRIHALLGGG